MSSHTIGRRKRPENRRGSLYGAYYVQGLCMKRDSAGFIFVRRWGVEKYLCVLTADTINS